MQRTLALAKIAKRATLDLPPLDRWEEPLRWLTPAQRERFESPEFYRLLETQVSRRFEALLRSNE